MDAAEAEARLDTALARRKELVTALASDLAAYRLVNGDGDGFDGLTVDRYGPALLVEQHLRRADPAPLLAALTARLGEAQPTFFKQRWSRDEAPRSGLQVSGEGHPSAFEVRERGLRFSVDLARGEHTGLFLDTRAARAVARREARARRVLNLFAYTGAFGVAAADGGARSTTNVDNKRTLLDVARRNYALNDAPADTRTFLDGDAIRFLNRTARGRGRFDLVIVDPPPRFKKRGGRGFHAREGYGRLVARCLSVLAPGGKLLAGLSALDVDEEAFVKHLADGAASRQVELRTVERIEPDVDFPPATGRPICRFALCEVDDG